MITPAVSSPDVESALAFQETTNNGTEYEEEELASGYDIPTTMLMAKRKRECEREKEERAG